MTKTNQARTSCEAGMCPLNGYLEIRSPWNKRSAESPEEIWETFYSYVEHSHENPIEHPQIVKFQGSAEVVDLPKIRPLTVLGFCNYMGITQHTFQRWADDEDEDLKTVVAMINGVISDSTLQGAMSGVYNATLAARVLNLAEKTEVQTITIEEKDKVDEEHQAVHVHPDDPDPLNLPRPLFSRAQLKAGIKFTDLGADSEDISSAVGE